MVGHCSVSSKTKFQYSDGLAMKYLQLIYYLLVSTLSLGQELAPAIISVAGDHYSNDHVQLSWSLGGSLLDSYANDNLSLSSGVQSEETNTFVLGFSGLDLAAQIFPNPVIDRLTVQLEESTRFNVVISDLTGREVFIGNPRYTNSQLIDLSHLSIGAYMLLILNQDSEPIKKIKLSKTR